MKTPARKEEAQVELLLEEWRAQGIGYCNCGATKIIAYATLDHSPSCNSVRMRVCAVALARYDARVAEEGREHAFRNAQRTRKHVQRDAKAKGHALRVAAMKAARAS